MLSLFAAVALCQVAVAQQPDAEAMTATVKEARARRPLDPKALLAIKQGPIDATLAADLLDKDWLLVGAWSYPEKKFSPSYLDDDVEQFDLTRYLPDGQELRFTFHVDAKQLTHLNFTLPSPQRVSFTQLGKQTWLQRLSYGEKELHRVVSYDKGVLIIDVSYDGVPNSKKVKFRDVWVAMPRRFESNGI